MTDKKPKPDATLLSRALQSYLETHHMKQQVLAEYLSIDVRTLGR